MGKKYFDLMRAMVIIVFLFFTGCAGPSSVQTYSTQGCDIRGASIGVLSFYCAIPNVGNLVSDALSANLMDSRCRIIERTYLAEILEEHGLGQSGITEKFDYQAIREIVNVDYFIVGNVQALTSRYSSLDSRMTAAKTTIRTSGATARIVAVETGEVVMTLIYNPSHPVEISPAELGKTLAESIKGAMDGKKEAQGRSKGGRFHLKSAAKD
jgi:curli biogenesis system outer membrane secretion channel CsgG